jgi:hypothetical protein
MNFAKRGFAQVANMLDGVRFRQLQRQYAVEVESKIEIVLSSKFSSKQAVIPASDRTLEKLSVIQRRVADRSSRDGVKPIQRTQVQLPPKSKQPESLIF